MLIDSIVTVLSQMAAISMQLLPSCLEGNEQKQSNKAAELAIIQWMLTKPRPCVLRSRPYISILRPWGSRQRDLTYDTGWSGDF